MEILPNDDRAARLRLVLKRPGLPAAGDHARLMLRIAERRTERERFERSEALPRLRVRDVPMMLLGFLGLYLCICVWGLQP